MLSIELLRDDPEKVKENLKRRNNPELLEHVDFVIENDKRWREVIKEVNKLREKRNKLTEEITKAKKDGKDAKDLIKKAKDLPDKIKKLEDEKDKLEEAIREKRLMIPNLMDESVPKGEDDSYNKEIKKAGEPPEFDFESKDHLSILQDLDLIDRERASKVSGHGFYYLKGQLAKLDMALQRYALDFLEEKGYTIVEPPFMLRREPYEGVTSLEDFEDVLYKVEGEDLHLIATSEHTLASMFMNETLLEKDLPIKLAAVSPCFRKEVGTHGKYTKGLFRMHHFNKVEQFIFSHPDDSWDFHEELQETAEEFFENLGIHYRVVNVCTGDLGIVAAKKYDMEAWMGDGEYREITSNSNCTDYQSRRLGIKYREEEGKKPKDYVHTLNATCVATSRAMIAIIEQNQNEDGTVDIPEALHDYTGFKVLGK